MMKPSELKSIVKDKSLSYKNFKKLYNDFKMDSKVYKLVPNNLREDFKQELWLKAQERLDKYKTTEDKIKNLVSVFSVGYNDIIFLLNKNFGISKPTAKQAKEVENFIQNFYLKNKKFPLITQLTKAFDINERSLIEILEYRKGKIFDDFEKAMTVIDKNENPEKKIITEEVKQIIQKAQKKAQESILKYINALRGKDSIIVQQNWEKIFNMLLNNVNQNTIGQKFDIQPKVVSRIWRKYLDLLKQSPDIQRLKYASRINHINKIAKFLYK